MFARNLLNFHCCRAAINKIRTFPYLATFDVNDDGWQLSNEGVPDSLRLGKVSFFF